VTSQKNHQTCSKQKISKQVNLFIKKSNPLLFFKLALLILSFTILEKYSLAPLSTLSTTWQLSLGDNFFLNAKIELK